MVVLGCDVPCYHPIPAWYSRVRNESGKRGITFRLEDGFKDRPIELPCGKCIGCRLEFSRQWAVRCTHEMKLWSRNCFITLTYRSQALPVSGSLVPEHFVRFMKRVRLKYGSGIRFFHCGEYGELLSRPHHHAILFNHSFDDKRFYTERDGEVLWTSKSLEDLWTYGFCTVGEATFESAAYIARYSLKKLYGVGAVAHYGTKVPEYLTMSRRPGIGRGFIEKFRRDVYPSDEVIVRGRQCKPPRYYDKVLEEYAPSVLQKVKARRRRAAAEDPDSTGQRLIVREVVKEGAISSLRRDL